MFVLVFARFWDRGCSPSFLGGGTLIPRGGKAWESLLVGGIGIV